MDVKIDTKRLRLHFKGIYERFAGTGSREEQLRRLGKGAMLLVYTYLLSVTEGLFDTLPFALALLSALPDQIGFAYAGACLGALFGRGFLPYMLVGYTLILLVRTQIVRFLAEDDGKGRTEESLFLRCVISAAGALLVSGIPMIGNFTFYGLFGAFFMVFACPSMTLLFSGAFLAGRTSTLFSDGGWWLLRFCLVLACKEFSIFGFTPALTVATLISVWVYTKTNPISACFSGFFSGLAIGIHYGVMVAAVSLIGGVVHRFYKKASLGTGLLAGMAYAYAVLGLRAFFTVLPDLVCGGLLILPVWRMAGGEADTVTKKSPVAARQFLDKKEREIWEKQQENTAQSMHRLSQVFFTLTDNRFPDAEECESIANACMEKRCGACKGGVRCRGENDPFRRQAFSFASKELSKDGRVDGRFLSDIGCAYSAEIAEELTVDYARLYRQKTLPQAADAYAAGFEAVSKLLFEQKQYRYQANTPRNDLADILKEKARKLGLSFSNVGVYGNKKVFVFFCDCPAVNCRGGGEGLQKLCEEVIRCKMSYPRSVIEQTDSMILLETVPAYSIQHAEAKKPKQGQKICGDRVHMFADADQNPCLLLCDGMGSGVQAAIASGIGCTVSECLAQAGATPRLITELLNTTLRHRQREDSCTFDLFSFDRYCGMGTFIKSGAAPTLVFRQGKAYKLSAGTPPLGVISDPCPEQIRMQLQAGDLVVMASDGIAADFEDAVALAAIVSGYENETPEELAWHILDRCGKDCQDAAELRRSDDMSVCVVKILAI